MTGSTDAVCRVDGAQYLSVSATENEVCTLFQDRFFVSLGETSAGDQMSFALTIEESGTINAIVSKTSDGVQMTYPSVSVDVMDRGLNLSDVERVAEAAAQMMTNELGVTVPSGS